VPTSMSNGCDRAERGTDVGWQLASREKPHHATQSVERTQCEKVLKTTLVFPAWRGPLACGSSGPRTVVGFVEFVNGVQWQSSLLL
jgi:hypothetical protein